MESIRFDVPLSIHWVLVKMLLQRLDKHNLQQLAPGVVVQRLSRRELVAQFEPTLALQMLGEVHVFRRHVFPVDAIVRVRRGFNDAGVGLEAGQKAEGEEDVRVDVGHVGLCVAFFGELKVSGRRPRVLQDVFSRFSCCLCLLCSVTPAAFLDLH